MPFALNPKASIVIISFALKQSCNSHTLTSSGFTPASANAVFAARCDISKPIRSIDERENKDGASVHRL